MFPTDRSLWVAGSRRVRVMRLGDNGKYRTWGLPAGDYYIVALADPEAFDTPSAAAAR